MTTELGKSCESGEAVLALKKHIGKCTLDNERLKDEIAANKRRDDFVARFRWALKHVCVDMQCACVTECCCACERVPH
jgi:hypothetical protein